MIRDFPEPERELTDRLFARRDLSLIAALAEEPLAKNEAACLTEGMEMDTERSLYMLALGILGFRRGWEIFPAEAVPRLKGLHRYYQVRGTAAAPWLCTQMDRLQAAGIPFVLTGGSAMRAFYAPDVPRYMYGYDMTVPSRDYERAAELLRDGVRGASDANGDRTVSGITKILLHRGVPDERIFSEDAFWERCGRTEFLGRSVLVPAAEDMLLHLLCVPQGPWVFHERREDRDRRLYEACFLLRKQRMDFTLFGELAAAHGQVHLVRFWLRVLTTCAPDLLPEEQWTPFFQDVKGYDVFLNAMTRLAVETERRDKEQRESIWASWRLACAEYRVVRTEGGGQGFAAYLRETRGIQGIRDLLNRVGAKKDDR